MRRTYHRGGVGQGARADARRSRNSGLVNHPILSLESDRLRLWALLIFIAAAVVSPAISTPSGLPALRLEQIWLALLVPSVILYHRNHPELRRPLFVDWAFFALGVATLLTLALAPLFVDGVSRSFRDIFELARVVEYWLAFRLAFAAWGARPDIRPIVLLIAASAGGSGLLAALQYLDPGGLNDAVTDAWANAHNLNAAIRNGRSVGFIGNPNYYGVFSGLFLAFLVAFMALEVGRGLDRRLLGTVAVAAGLATAGIVLSQSRTATGATIAALAIGLVWSLFVNRHRISLASYLAPVATVLLAGFLTFGFAELFPPEFGSVRARFNPGSFSSDSSLSLRITRWRTLLQSSISEPPSVCTTEPLDDTAPPSRAPAVAGSISDPTAVERDEQRRDDIRMLADAIMMYVCDEDEWPVENTETLLVPEYLDSVPRDPLSEQPYDLYVTSDGFIASATLENEDAPAGPTFALGTLPNYVKNDGFESGEVSPSNWRTSGASDGRSETTLTIQDQARFGEKSILANVGGGSAFYQQVVHDFGIEREYTVNVWAKAGAEPETAQIYLIGTTADGRTLDPLARSEHIELAPESWSSNSLTFVTPASSRIVVISILIRSIDEADSVDAFFDAITLTAGPFVPSYPWVRQASPADRRPLPGFADSPFIGVGPLKGIELGALDNEYGLFLDRYGLVGLAAYFALFGAALWIGVKASMADSVETATLGLGLTTGIVALMVFSIAAGSYYNFQLMALFWPLVGLTAARLKS